MTCVVLDMTCAARVLEVNILDLLPSSRGIGGRVIKFTDTGVPTRRQSRGRASHLKARALRTGAEALAAWPAGLWAGL